MMQKEEASIKKSTSYESLKQFIIKTFKISWFIKYYFNQNNKEVNITENEEFKKSSGINFNIEKKDLDESIYERIVPNLNGTHRMKELSNFNK